MPPWPTVRPMTTVYAIIGFLRYLLIAVVLAAAGHIVFDPDPLVSPPGVALGTLAALVLVWLIGDALWKDFLTSVAVVAVITLGPDTTAVANFVYGMASVILASSAWHILARDVKHSDSQPEAPGYDPDRKMVGLWGYAGAGKDTAAEALVNWDGWTRVAVSDKILEFALRINPVIGYEAETPGAQIGNGRHTAYAHLSDLVDHLGVTEAKKIPEVRALFQDVGVAVRDMIDPDAWVKATMNDLPEGNIVFTSTRFPNEAQAITDAGGKIIRVTRPGVHAVNGHITETALEDWDFDGELINDSTPHEAGVRLRQLVKTLF